MNDLLNRVDKILQEYKPGAKNEEEIVQELFDIHNEVTGLNEVAIKCGGCRKRVYNRLKEWWVLNN